MALASLVSFQEQKQSQKHCKGNVYILLSKRPFIVSSQDVVLSYKHLILK